MSKVDSENLHNDLSGNIDNQYAINNETSKQNEPDIDKLDVVANDMYDVVKKKSSFGAIVNKSIQLTWKDITIKSPPKKLLWKKIDSRQQEKIIIGKWIAKELELIS